LSMGDRKRLDTLLVERGLFESRSKAAAAVLAGDISLGTDERAASKPGMPVPVDAELHVRQAPPYVSRGGVKLERALATFGLDVGGRLCLDVGASTGGFTDRLLQAGAERVVTVDVGYGELHWKLRSDPRVTVLERLNARRLQPADLPYAPDLIVVDVSFIGLAKVLPAIRDCAAMRFDLVALVKPQFEVGRDRVQRGGVVRSADDRLQAMVAVGQAARSLDMSVQRYCDSGLPGPAGNREAFIWCAEGSRPGVEDLVAAAATAEQEGGATLRAARRAVQAPDRATVDA
jgi:23S rRNA (cytidine1920-2'-O)/16S rRNA (cytidine1409-2'-O)-methyltransferase